MNACFQVSTFFIDAVDLGDVEKLVVEKSSGPHWHLKQITVKKGAFAPSEDVFHYDKSVTFYCHWHRVNSRAGIARPRTVRWMQTMCHQCKGQGALREWHAARGFPSTEKYLNFSLKMAYFGAFDALFLWFLYLRKWVSGAGGVSVSGKPFSRKKWGGHTGHVHPWWCPWTPGLMVSW